ncbi:MAG: sigma-54-dependent Fis family transcriptional regulator [Oligoflexia bacterium]|nr:sigma-54-dependent Fis family transcriptional regulator [Oligoflexia bacterium]
MVNRFNLLLVEDNRIVREEIIALLNHYVNVDSTASEKEAKLLLSKKKYDICIIDLVLENGGSGLKVLKEAKKLKIFSIVLTNNYNKTMVKDAFNLNCDLFIAKTKFRNIIVDVVKNQLAMRSGLLDTFFHEKFITVNPKLKEDIISVIQKSINNRSLFIYGPTGTGKTFLAKLMHDIFANVGKNNTKGNFIDINISAIPETMVEAELFGYVRGAFSGAIKSKTGLIKKADGGTLFLDEIASASPAIQAKLLKVIEEKRFYPLGSDTPIESNFRLITATCDDIYKKIGEEKFRLDLFHRINEVFLSIPPLKERKEDIGAIIDYFLEKNAIKILLEDDVVDFLQRYSWEGNVRELLNVLSSLIGARNKVITISELPQSILHKNDDKKNDFLQAEIGSFASEAQVDYALKQGVYDCLEKIEAGIFCKAISRFHGKNNQAREALRVDKATFYRKLGKYNLKDTKEKQI